MRVRDLEPGETYRMANGQSWELVKLGKLACYRIEGKGSLKFVARMDFADRVVERA